MFLSLSSSAYCNDGTHEYLMGDTKSCNARSWVNGIRLLKQILCVHQTENRVMQNENPSTDMKVWSFMEKLYFHVRLLVFPVHLFFNDPITSSPALLWVWTNDIPAFPDPPPLPSRASHSHSNSIDHSSYTILHTKNNKGPYRKAQKTRRAMLSSDNASSPPLRVKQDEFHLPHILGILLFGIANIPSPYPARPARPFAPAALSHPSADRTHGAPGCPPASPPAGPGPSGSQPRPQRSLRQRKQLSALQLEPGRGGSGSSERRPRVALQVCVSGYSGPGGLGGTRLPADAGGNSSNGIYVLFFGNSLYKHHRARRAPQN